jgi:uncharacterized protein with FMN-binding domain
MAKKMSRRTLALSLSAITAVYLAGYVVTEPTAQKIAAAEASGSVALAPAPTTAATTLSVPTVADAATTLDATPEPAPTLPPDATPTRAPTATAIPTARPTRVIPRPTTTPASQPAGYRDGTYVGLGRSRRGNVEVTVTIKSGKIASASISNCMTQYPQSVIDGLPDEVVSRQSAKVDLVSGATYSSRAFQDAVIQALAQAGQAPATGAILGVRSFA